MKIIAIDDEMIALKNLEFKLHECRPDAECHFFQKEEDILSYLSDAKADVAFLDICIGKTNGLLLAKKVRELCPSCAVIFLTGYSEYAVEAFKLKANGYLMKPVSTEDLQSELDYLETKKSETGRPINYPEDKLVVKCFGNFDVFYQGKPVAFSRSKSKELLAYLVDRNGAQVTMPQISSILWADGMYNHSRNNQIHSYLHDLTKNLQDITRQEIILRKRNAISIDVTKLDCDYHRFLQGDAEAVNAYTGEYMSQYWWSEFTTGSLSFDMLP